MCDWEMNIHCHGSSEWGLCPYHENFIIVAKISLSTIEIVTKTWVGCVSLVKTILVF
jgi:hypothetical protein